MRANCTIVRFSASNGLARAAAESSSISLHGTEGPISEFQVRESLAKGEHSQSVYVPRRLSSGASCSDACQYNTDGFCDDGGPGA
eukprot:5907941-Prymnesium_polylepis.1